MARINFNTVDDIDDFSPLPEGQYLCRLAEVEEASTQYGDDMWKIRFVVAEGASQGRYIFDNLVFSEAALKRVKLVCSRLGLDVSGEVELTPDLLRDRTCLVSVEIEDYEDSEGNIKQRNAVPFAGYEQTDVAAAGAAVSEKDDGEELFLPF